ncbi:MAG TPA: ABC transporter permease [Acidimicrobiia bacterium]|nr:ABC transporter permease [Acidimicrobiia bacterium]
MSLTRTFKVLGKDLRFGPRSPVFLWVLGLPLAFTLVLQVTFGSLFDPKPRLGIVDEGSSTITTAVQSMDGIQLALIDNAGDLKAQVEANDLDAGLVLQSGFDDLVRGGARPPLEFYVGGESLASNRIILAVTTIDLVREIEGTPPPVEVDVVALGDEGLPIAVRLVPFIMMYALVVAAVFLPAFSLADEREKGTLNALIVTPVKLSEVVTAKGMLGVILALAMTVFTLWLNDALGADPLALLVVLLFGAILCVEVGLIYGAASKDVTSVFTLIKGTGILLIGPTVFYIFPDWPQWIGKLFPTYWVINPIFEVSLNNAGLDDVWVELLVAVGVIAVLAIPIVLLTRRLGTKLAMAA